jgi:hypothetical protein
MPIELNEIIPMQARMLKKVIGNEEEIRSPPPLPQNEVIVSRDKWKRGKKCGERGEKGKKAQKPVALSPRY